MKDGRPCHSLDQEAMRVRGWGGPCNCWSWRHKTSNNSLCQTVFDVDPVFHPFVIFSQSCIELQVFFLLFWAHETATLKNKTTKNAHCIFFYIIPSLPKNKVWKARFSSSLEDCSCGKVLSFFLDNTLFTWKWLYRNLAGPQKRRNRKWYLARLNGL